jgi:hypothetical protein
MNLPLGAVPLVTDVRNADAAVLDARRDSASGGWWAAWIPDPASKSHELNISQS